MTLFQKNTKNQGDAPPGVALPRRLISKLCREGRLDELVEEYISLCHCPSPIGSDAAEGGARSKAKPRVRFPNLAGLCRYIGTGISDIPAFATDFPEEYDKLIAVFEDEALNSDVSPTLLSAYLKKRMRYAYAEDAREHQSKEVSFCFEHDIFADGE